MSGTSSTAQLATLRNSVFADPALLSRLSTIADQEAVLDELMAVANANNVQIDSHSLRQAIKAELGSSGDGELTDNDLEMVAAGTNSAPAKNDSSGKPRS